MTGGRHPMARLDMGAGDDDNPEGIADPGGASDPLSLSLEDEANAQRRSTRKLAARESQRSKGGGDAPPCPNICFDDANGTETDERKKICKEGEERWATSRRGRSDAWERKKRPCPLRRVGRKGSRLVGTISCFCLDNVAKVMMLGAEAIAIEAVGCGRMDDVVACNRSRGLDGQCLGKQK
jgi:hypothetical protein